MIESESIGQEKPAAPPYLAAASDFARRRSRGVLLLLDAPSQVAPGATDAIALQETRLVEIVSTAFDDDRLRLTRIDSSELQLALTCCLT
jgi:hypothetical protein